MKINYMIKFRNELLKIQWAKELEEILKGCQGGNVGSQLKTKSSSDQNQQQPIQKNNSIQQQKNLISKKRKLIISKFKNIFNF